MLIVTTQIVPPIRSGVADGDRDDDDIGDDPLGRGCASVRLQRPRHRTAAPRASARAGSIAVAATVTAAGTDPGPTAARSPAGRAARPGPRYPAGFASRARPGRARSRDTRPGLDDGRRRARPARACEGPGRNARGGGARKRAASLMALALRARAEGDACSPPDQPGRAGPCGAGGACLRGRPLKRAAPLARARAAQVVPGRQQRARDHPRHPLPVGPPRLPRTRPRGQGGVPSDSCN